MFSVYRDCYIVAGDYVGNYRGFLQFNPVRSYYMVRNGHDWLAP